MPDAHANFAASLVAVAPSPATTGLSLTVTTGEGAVFPTGTFNATARPANTAPTGSNSEIIRCTRSGDVLTIVRAQEGTTAKSIAIGWVIEVTVTKKSIEDANGLNQFYARPQTDVVPIVVRHSAAGQTAELQEWRSQADAVLARVNNLGQMIEGGRRLAKLTSRITADATTTSVAPTHAASGLSISLEAGKAYYFRAQGFWRTSLATAGLALRMNGTCTATRIKATTKIWAATGVAPFLTNSVALPTAAIQTAGGTINTDFQWEVEGFILVNAAGTFIVEYAAEVAATLTLRQDSILLAEEVA